jgi:hypothetical protein
MTKKQTLGLFFLGGLSAIIACDNGSGGTTSGLGSDDCPLGTFRPDGFPDCVIPAHDLNQQQVVFSDNRCSTFQGAVPPTCVSETGARAYISMSTTCAPGYRYFPAACNRGVGGFGGFGDVGTAGTTGFGTGAAGTFATGGFGGSCPFGVDPATNVCLSSPPGSAGMGLTTGGGGDGGPPAGGGAGGSVGGSGGAGGQAGF